MPHLQNPNRVDSAGIAIEELESQCLVLDDGFQHRRLHRDLDWVLVDALNPFGLAIAYLEAFCVNPDGA